jgi:integrase
MKDGSVIVRHKTVTVTIWPWQPRPGVTHWKFLIGRRQVSRNSLERAKAEALAHARSLTSHAPILTDQQAQVVRRLVEVDPSLAVIDEFLAWKRRRYPDVTLADGRRAFLQSRLANQGRSKYHLEILRKHVELLPDMPLAEFGLADFPAITGAPRTRLNVIRSWRQLFRWCVKQGWLPSDEPTAADRLDTPAIAKSMPSIWTPAELGKLIAAVSPDAAPWLALAAWAGLRTEEVSPARGSGKDGVRWGDVDFCRGQLVIRPEVSKTGSRRIVPLVPPLASMLRCGHPSMSTDARIGPVRAAHTPSKGGVAAETTRLGAAVGGWRRNALRHSFISYRAAIVGIGQAALEAGNSEAEARKSYLDAVTREDAEAWFALDLAAIFTQDSSTHQRRSGQ